MLPVAWCAACSPPRAPPGGLDVPALALLRAAAGEDGAAVETVEIAPNVNADYDGSGTLLGIEVLGAGGLSVETIAAGVMKANEAA